MQSIIQLEHVYKRYPVGDGEFEALADINLSFGAGQFAGLVGPSGSGKTTLLNIIGSLNKPTEGKAIVLGQDVGGLSNKKSANLRNEDIGFIFQVFNLLPVYTVFENVEFALLLQNIPTTKRKKRVMESLT
jgi:putative ABC transport system ATP-binding protein